jgi:HD-GYP domain-containing protein (c-di-GMP phosphodiesterase class II)
MQSTTPSITESGQLSPEGNSSRLAERFSQLAGELRQAPMTHESDALIAQAIKFLAEAPADVINADRVMCLLFIGRHLLFSGRANAAHEPVSAAVEIAKRLQDAPLQVKALKILGLIYLESGSYPDTVSTFSAALEGAKSTGSYDEQAQILSNLGLAHQYAGHYSAAVPCYQRAIELADQIGNDQSTKSVALANLAFAYLHLRDIGPGIAAAEQAIEGLQDPTDAHDRGTRVMAECYYARLLLEVRNFPLARERAAIARDFARDATEIAKLTATMTQGLVEVYEPASRDIGLSRLQRAVNDSRKSAPSALRDALAMIVRGYEAAGQPNAALVYLDEVVQLNRDSRVRSVLTHHHKHLAKIGNSLDVRAQAAITEQREALRFQRLSMDVLRECMSVLEKNTVAAELHDDDTGEHCYRVGALARELALRSGMDEEMCTLIDLSARLHDIGKLRVPDSILLKPGRFNADERAIMEAHCQHGWELIGEGGLAQLFVAQEIALNHHERWDGTGYPNRRAGNMIPLAARVTALADVFDALTHRRCYKEAWSVDDALREIAQLRGKHFDPELTDLFLALVPALQARHGNLDAYLGIEARKNDFIADRVRVARELKADQETFDARR